MVVLGNEYTGTKGIWKLAQVLEGPSTSQLSAIHLNGSLLSFWGLHPVEVCATGCGPPSQDGLPLLPQDQLHKSTEPYKMKIWAPCLKRTQNFQTVTAELQTKRGALGTGSTHEAGSVCMLKGSPGPQ